MKKDLIQRSSAKKCGLSKVLFLICVMIFIVFDLSNIHVALAGDQTLVKPQARFFLMGDGRVVIKNAHNGRVVDVRYVDDQGKMVDAAFTEIDRVFGFPTIESAEHVSFRTIAMLDYFSDLFAPKKTIVLTSGYRSPTYNQKIRDQGGTVAKTSTHIDGMALDFYLDGVSGREMWETIRHKDCCGVGHYGGNVIHLDSGKPRFWETATSKVRTGASDFNQFIYLSTEYDRYQHNQHIRMFFTSVSDFGFGIKTDFSFVMDKDGEEKMTRGKIYQGGRPVKQDCLKISTRKDARFIETVIPQNLKPGEYRIKVDFCDKPFVEMPDQTVTNGMEIISK